MNRRNIDLVWRVLALAAVDVVNPLLLISLALFCGLGYILTLLAPVDIDIWSALLCFSVLAPLPPLLIRARRLWARESRKIPPFGWRALLPLLVMVALAPGWIFILAYPSLKAISHIDIYFVYVAQLYNGFAPPENLYLPGLNPSHYWIFHAFIAALVKLTAMDVYSVTNLANGVLVFSGVYWLAQTLLELKLSKPRSLGLVFALLFLLGALNLTGVFSIAGNALAGVEQLLRPEHALLAGADRRLHSPIIKLVHASGMTPGFAAFAATLYCCVRLLRRKPDLLKLVIVSASCIVALAVMPILGPFVGLIPLSLAPIGLFLLARGRGGAGRMKVAIRSYLTEIQPGMVLAWLLLSLALALPLLHYVMSIMQSVPGALMLSLASPVNTGMTIAAHLLLLPFVLLHLIGTVKRPRRESVFFLLVIAAGLVLALSIELGDLNQYKFHYLLSVLMALSSLTALSSWLNSSSRFRRRMARLALVALVTLALMNVIYGQVALSQRALYRYGTARFAGVHTYWLKNDYARRLSALNWIRDNTPYNAVVILPYVYTEYAGLISGRAIYLRDPGNYDFYIPDIDLYKARRRRTNVFFDDDISLDAYRALMEVFEAELPGRPLYAVVYGSDLASEVLARRGARLVFEDSVDAARVYFLNPA